MIQRQRHHRWWLAAAPDIVEALAAQCEITVKGIDGLVAWSAADAAPAVRDAAADAVRAAEHEADDARRNLARMIRQAFVTPVNPEDLFELSERLDVVMNGAKNLVREAEVLATEPDRPMSTMAGQIAAGVLAIHDGLPQLASNPPQAYEAAERAIASQHDLEKTYRIAMGGLLEESDNHVIAARRELYRRCARLSEAVEAVADRIQYTVIKDT